VFGFFMPGTCSIRGTGNALGGKVRYYPNTPMGGISRQRSGRVIARVDEAGAEGTRGNKWWVGAWEMG